MRNLKKFQISPVSLYATLTILTVVLAIAVPADQATLKMLHTSEAAYRLAVTVLLVPYLLIWYASYYAYAKLRQYALPLKRTTDGAAFHKLSRGMGALAYSLVLPTMISLIINAFAGRHPSWHNPVSVIITYVGLYPGLISFLLLYNGSRNLVETIKGKIPRLDVRWTAPFFLLLGAAFAHLAVYNQRHFDTYHMPVVVLLITVITPYLYGWLIGLLCAHELVVYARTVKGLLYRAAVKQFALGIGITILGSIAVQFVTITLAQHSHRSLGLVLLLDYGLLIIIATGLLLMAFGAKKLRRLEEI